MSIKLVMSALLLALVTRPISSFAQSSGDSDLPAFKTVSIEWTAPSSQAESVIDLLEVDASLQAQQNLSSDTKAFPVAIVITGLVVFERLSATLFDIYRESRPGAIVQRKPNGAFTVTQVKNLPPGCVIYDNGDRVTECIYSNSTSSEDATKLLLNHLASSPK